MPKDFASSFAASETYAEAETVKTLVAREMEAAAKLAVPLTAEAKSGRSWYEAK